LSPHQSFIAISFVAFLLLFIGVGIVSGLRQDAATTDDYLLAGRDANPWLTGLSTVATGNSGFMFIGLIGFTYTVGISALWVVLGWIFGDYLAWSLVHRRLRRVSEEQNSSTVVEFLSQENAGDGRWITLTSGLITIAFLAVYAATQLQAGSKALSVIFGWDYAIGIVLGAVIVTVYCFAGGIQASIWVGSIQSALMIVSMVMLVGVAIAGSGGPLGLWRTLKEIDPTLLSLAPPNLKFGMVPFALSWLAAGFGVVGQPHIMSRIMAIDSGKHIKLARNVYTSLYVVFALAALGVGLTARVLLPDLIVADTELALPELAEALLPGLLVGVVLSGLFAATISTADAQLLTCSATLTQDVLFRWTANSLPLARLGTLAMAVVICMIALVGADNVFVLATIAWSTLAASLGPLMIVRALGRPIKTAPALAMMVTGMVTALIWRLGLDLADSVCEALPGMTAGAMMYLATVWLTKHGSRTEIENLQAGSEVAPEPHPDQPSEAETAAPS
jgi:sodium/proline symporter